MLTRDQSSRIARTFWRWRNILGLDFGDGGRHRVGAYAMTQRKFPNVSRGTIYRHAQLWADVYGDGSRLHNFVRTKVRARQ